MTSKIVFKLIGISLVLSAGSAFADTDRWQTRPHDHGRLVIRAENHHGYRGGYGHHHGHRWGWAPWASAAIIGSTFYWANNSFAPPPSTTVIVSPPVVTDPSRVAYFCQTAQQYYPQVPTCNVPWQLVNY